MTKEIAKPHLFEQAVRKWSAASDIGDVGRLLSEVRSPSRSDTMPSAIPFARNATAPRLEAATLYRLARRPWRQAKRSRMEEEFRLIATQILRGAPDNALANCGHAVMISSPRPGEGKSFFALNIALTLAENASRAVVLVDLDRRHGALSDRLQIDKYWGVQELQASGANGLEAALVGTGVAGLSVLPYGVSLIGETDTPMPIAQLMRELTVRLPGRILILDAPPCLSDSDPTALAGVVDQVLMVVQAQATSRSALEASLDLVQSCASISLVLNQVRVRTGYRFGEFH
jgi:receptor protein-tyrosine kinase